MKVWKKLQVVFLALLWCSGMMTQPALTKIAASGWNRSSLDNRQRNFTSRVKEIQSYFNCKPIQYDTAVTNLSLENILPEKFCAGRKCGDNKKMESLQAGETVTLTKRFVR